MHPIRAIWRAATHGVLATTALLAVHGLAQAQTYGGYPGGSYYGGGYGGYTPTPVVPTPPPPPAASLVLSKRASSNYQLGQYTGSLNQNVTIQTVTVNGKTTSYKQYGMSLTPTDVAFTGNLGSERPNGGGFRETLTWSMLDPTAIDNLEAKGGTFQMSDIRWQQRADGGYSITGTVSGESLDQVNLLAPTRIEAFSVQPANVSSSLHTTTLGGLAMTTSMFDSMALVLGLDESGLGYASLLSSSTDFGTLTVTGQIPEPGTWAMWALGLMGMAGLHRRNPLRRG